MQQLVDLSPRRISNFQLSGETFYVTAYELDPNTNGAINPVVLAVDRVTGAVVGAPFPTTGVASIWPGLGGDLYAVESAASATIWRLHEGSAPSAIVTARNLPRVATADATHLYWSEAAGSTHVIRRKAFASSTIEDVMTCDQPMRLFVDATDVYCAAYGSAPLRAPKAGGGPVTGFVYSGNIVTSMVADGGTLYFTDISPKPKLWKLPMPNGPVSLVDEQQTIGRYEGLALTSSYFYTIDNTTGLRRIHRSSLAVDLIYNALFVGRDPVIASGQLYFAANNPQLGGMNYLMHCVD